MFERETRLSQFMAGYLHKVVGEMSDEQCRQTTIGAVNPPSHVLGHLAISNDSALRLLGQPMVCPKAWHTLFGPSAIPPAPDAYPTKETLLERFEVGHAAVCAAAVKADEDTMNQSHAIALFHGSPVATIGDLVALLMTTHLSLHIGQLSLMRRQLGHPPLF
ncbi:DinB superfamily protein [Anatilimnocola aggregata]|uniref:DinB superfamily protein n=1 Tax=Anatilimnocola aggregata TaxID=2528021 RepID=A0A517YB14_9BACT|nr:DinB family protein [Anatilimnocola aggregata]QDU27389.1 DinB superfamily protein [Anatilimnocola aggregata]